MFANPIMQKAATLKLSILYVPTVSEVKADSVLPFSAFIRERCLPLA